MTTSGSNPSFHDQPHQSSFGFSLKKRYIATFIFLCIQVSVVYFFYASEVTQYWVQKNAYTQQDATQEMSIRYLTQHIQTLSNGNVSCSNATCLLKNESSSISADMQNNGSKHLVSSNHPNGLKVIHTTTNDIVINKHGIISGIVPHVKNKVMGMVNQAEVETMPKKMEKKGELPTASNAFQNTSIEVKNDTSIVNTVVNSKLNTSTTDHATSNVTSLNVTDPSTSVGDTSTRIAGNSSTVASKIYNANVPFEYKNIILPQCPEEPPGLQGHIEVSFTNDPNSMSLLEEDNPLVSGGGHFKPPYCTARWKVAIIIPFRDRDEHLQYFLQYMHPTLQRQQLEYRIYIVNQLGKGKFNRAKLMNVGYAESIKDLDFDCFVFHDVDLILENDKAIYKCPDQPRHLSVGVDKFNYRLPYASIFGGVTQLTKEQFTKVNGYSNSFWGWGGEDDDMYNRVRRSGYHVIRYPVQVSRYRMISHQREKGNEENPKRFALIQKTAQLMKTDGLNSLKYQVTIREDHQLYTNITVDVFGST